MVLSDWEGEFGYNYLDSFLDLASSLNFTSDPSMSLDLFGFGIWEKANYLLSKADIVSFLLWYMERKY